MEPELLGLHEILQIVESSQTRNTTETYISFNFETNSFETTQHTIEEINIFEENVNMMQQRLTQADLTRFQAEMICNILPDKITNKQILKNPYI